MFPLKFTLSAFVPYQFPITVLTLCKSGNSTYRSDTMNGEFEAIVSIGNDPPHPKPLNRQGAMSIIQEELSSTAGSLSGVSSALQKSYSMMSVDSQEEPLKVKGSDMSMMLLLRNVDEEMKNRPAAIN
ncbi:hypothetical protein C0992_012797 [Termitomyces sp. T32_za158]|nr:hypothetical protein C0992_012797 [Termitomyces sp. T32_za158]